MSNWLDGGLLYSRVGAGSMCRFYAGGANGQATLPTYYNVKQDKIMA